MIGSCLVIKRLFFHKYYKTKILVDSFVITPEWKTLDAKNLIVVDKDVHFISLAVEPPFRAFKAKGFGISDPDGDIVNPEIILVSASGNEYYLKCSGARQTSEFDFANYEYEGKLSAGERFEKVVLRSDVAIPVKRIQWSGYDIKDLP